MNVRLLPWVLFAVVVLVLAVRAGILEGKGDAPSVLEPAARAMEKGPEIRLWPVDVRELHDDGVWNRLAAEEAVYSYARKTIRGTDVTITIASRAAQGTVLHAPEALWDLEGKTVLLPNGGDARREGGWRGEISSAVLDLAGRTLRAAGTATITGPGVEVAGKNLTWRWGDGMITMDSPKSRVAPAGRRWRKG